ncbi:MAG: hypothetical protein E7633_04720 [Ruminococcaceae bacterium]|nr:hypothetical protein [Oscillospiraceae bacterium]
MAKINIDFKDITGKIKPVHGVGQPPFEGIDFSMFKHLKNAGIPFSRLHDVGGAYGGGRWVDVPNIFRDFDANPYEHASYDFAFTDLMIKALMENNCVPFFRLGVTIENAHRIKAYRVYPPKDFKKWAIICEHIIRHYTEGWCNGFKYDIKYWEIWNEPDNNPNWESSCLWRGSPEEYFEFYEIASKHLKQRFPHLKIGGYGSCGFYNLTGSDGSFGMCSSHTEHFIKFMNGFLAYVKKTGAPFDFFSWHTYDGDVKNNIIYANYARKRLDEEGFTETETSCNEWNCRVNLRGTAKHAALTGAVMLAFQNLPVDNAMFYDARFGTSVYGSLFNPLTREPFPAYYAFTAFNRLYALENQAKLELGNDDIYAVAATDGATGCIVITNPTDDNISIDLSMDACVTKSLITVDGANDAEFEFANELPANSIVSLYVDVK